MIQFKKFLSAFVLLLLLPASAIGAERVHISASKSGTYDVEKQIFQAEGDITITYGALILQGQTMQVDFVSGEVQIQGDVTLNQDGQEIYGEYLIYNLETGEGTFEQAHSEIPLATNTGSIFLFGNSVDLDENSYKVHNAKFTTCDHPDSHFHVATKELEVILGEKVIIRGVTYYEGKIPLFYWPYLVIPLDSDDAERFFNLPEVGVGDYEGYYMKNTFNYYFNSNSYGNLYVDLFSRLGVALGFRHYYELNSLGKGSFYLYGLPKANSPVVKGAFNHEWSQGGFTLKTNTNYEDSWIRRETSTENSLTFTQPQLTAQAWYNYKTNPQLQVASEKQYGASWAQTLTDSWRLNLQGTWTERDTTQTTLRILDYLAETTYRKDKHTLSFAVQQQYNPDLLKSNVQPWRRVQRIPELKWDVSDLGLAKLPLKSQVSIGRYEEYPSLVKETRMLGQLGLKPQVWRPFSATSINYQGDVTTTAYGDGQRQTTTYGRVGLNQKIGTSLQLSTTYTRRDVWGSTPFLFDRQRATEDLSVRLSYNDSKWQASLSSGYNFKTNKYGTLVLQARYRPTEDWNLNLYSYYNIQEKQLLRVVPMVEYKKNDVDLKLATRYRPTDQVVERLDARITIPLGATWKIGYDSIFEPPKGTFTQGRLSITKDLHCRTLALSWDHVAKRFAVQYTINAFPTLPIGWDSQGGVSLFDLEDVADIVGIEE